jgi:exodeoxyribonuclease VII large subunit
MLRAQATDMGLLKTRQSGLAHRLGTVSPLATLGRGYSISTVPDTGSIVRTLDDLDKENALDVRITDAVLHCRVTTHTAVKE